MPYSPIPENNQPRKPRLKPARSQPFRALTLPERETSIFRLKGEDIRMGRCDICGEPTELAFRDASTRQTVGKCCLKDMIFADRAAESVGHLMRRTTFVESTRLTQ